LYSSTCIHDSNINLSVISSIFVIVQERECNLSSGADALWVVEDIGRIVLGLELLETWQVATPVLLLGVNQLRIDVSSISTKLSIRHRALDFVVDVGKEGLGGVGNTGDSDGVGLDVVESITMAVGGGIGGDIVDGATLEIEDRSPSEGSLVSGVKEGEEVLDGLARHESVITESQTLGVERSSNATSDLEEDVFSPMSNSAEPVVENDSTAVGGVW